MLHGLLILFGLVFFISPGLAEKRIALLIGNESYTREIGPLSNPVNDVNLIADTLRKIGFSSSDITIVKNGSRRQILRAVEQHTTNLANAGDNAVGFLYYSGHGIANQLDRRNYLIPVDVERFDVDVWYDAVPLDEIVSKLSKRAPRAANFVIFDACRNLLNATTKGGKGFVPVQTRRGMLIAFSTDPGETASDAGKGGGPYAKALAEQLARPGQDHLDLFQNVKEQVHRRTGVQVPWTRDGMLQRVYLAGKRSLLDRRAEIAFWRSVSTSTDPKVVRTYLKSYPEGEFAALARALAKNLQQAEREKANTRASSTRSEIASGQKQRTALAGSQNKRDAEPVAASNAVPQLQSRDQQAITSNVEADQQTPLARDTLDGKTDEETNSPTSPNLQLTMNLQKQLARVGCDPGEIDGVWGVRSQRSIAMYNKHAKSKLEGSNPSFDALDHVRRQKKRVCPLPIQQQSGTVNSKPARPNIKSQPPKKTVRRRKDCMPFAVCLRKCQNDELPYPSGNCARVCGDYLVNTCKR